MTARLDYLRSSTFACRADIRVARWAQDCGAFAPVSRPDAGSIDLVCFCQASKAWAQAAVLPFDSG